MLIPNVLQEVRIIFSLYSVCGKTHLDDQWLNIPSYGCVQYLPNYWWLLTVVIGFPLDFFPVLFAVPRVVGWLAHWRQVGYHELMTAQMLNIT